MFKKNVTPSSNHQLSGKDAKELKRSLAKQYPHLSDDELAALLPNKAALSMTKLSNRSLVWSLESGSPLFFDPDGRGTILPTVYALAIVPHLVPTLHTWSEVSPKVLGGADLFLQGLLVPGSGLPDFPAGSVRALSVPGNPVPFAVGKMAVSKSEAVREQMKGRGLTVLHSYGDLLWQMGDKQPPNPGFQPNRIFPLAAEEGSSEQEQGSSAETGASGTAAGSAAAEQLEQLQLTSTGAEGAAAGSAEGGTEGSSGTAAGSGDEGGETAAASAAGAGEAAGDGAGASMDSLLESAVLAGLLSLTNASLPIMTSDFYTKFMVPNKPEGVVFDMKQSKYKKLSKLLDKFEKDKVITQKQIRKQDHITAVNRTSPMLTAFAAGQGTTAGASSSSSGGGKASTSGKAGGASGAQRVAVEYCWRVPSSLRPVFEGAPGAGDKDRLFSQEEVAAALQAYAEATGLAAVVGGRPSIKLDRLLLGMFSRKDELSEGAALPAEVVTRKLLEKLSQFHRLVRASDQGPVEVVRKGPVRPVGVAAERRHGRSVTVVSRVESFALSPDEMAGALQRKFQTSATVSKLPGKEEKDHEIMLQGELVKPVVAFLTETYGIPQEFMDVKAAKQGGKK